MCHRMQVAKTKLILEHLVVRKMGGAGGLKQSELDDILQYGAMELFQDNNATEQTPKTDDKKVNQYGIGIYSDELC